MSEADILVSGASGRTGGAAIDELLKLGKLTPDAELRSTVLREPVFGREKIKKLVAAVGSLYKSQKPIFFESVGTHAFLQYEAELVDGLVVHGTAVTERNPDGGVARVSVTFSPLGARSRLPVGSAGCSTGTLAKVSSSESAIKQMMRRSSRGPNSSFSRRC
jgi:hypothetical protein